MPVIGQTRYMFKGCINSLCLSLKALTHVGIHCHLIERNKKQTFSLQLVWLETIQRYLSRFCSSQVRERDGVAFLPVGSLEKAPVHIFLTASANHTCQRHHMDNPQVCHTTCPDMLIMWDALPRNPVGFQQQHRWVLVWLEHLWGGVKHKGAQSPVTLHIHTHGIPLVQSKCLVMTKCCMKVNDVCSSYQLVWLILFTKNVRILIIFYQHYIKLFASTPRL